MKQTLCFLIGLLIPLLIGTVSYAEECVSEAGLREVYENDLAGRDYHFLGKFATNTEARAAVDSFGTYNYYRNVEYGGKVYAFINGYYVSNDRYHEGYALIYDHDFCIVDSDGDGIPDEYDFYPDDNTPHLVRQIGYYTDDCSMGGTKVATLYETNKGDRYYTGVIPQENACFFQSIGYPWENPGGPISDDDFNNFDKSKETDASKKDVGPYEKPASNQDPQMQDGQDHDPADTPDQTQAKIADNTAATAKNVKRLGDYAASLDAAISSMEKNSAILADRAEQESLKDKQHAETVETGNNSLLNFDVEGALSGKIDGTITEGSDGDYKEHGALSEETWVTEFINTNPISTVLNQSGFHYSNSQCTSDLDLGYLGKHSINICSLEDGLIAFGNLLVALTTLIGLIHVVTGRGF